MERAELRELHYITPIRNVPSILREGILCHNRAAKVDHVDISMEEVQDIRKGKRLPARRDRGRPRKAGVR